MCIEDENRDDSPPWLLTASHHAWVEIYYVPVSDVFTSQIKTKGKY